MTIADTHVLGVEVQIHDVVQETADAISIVFDAEFSYTPGQFLTLRVPSDQTEFVARCYSLASAPATDSKPKVTVKRTRKGYASNWLCDNAKPGLTLRVLPPSGTFTATTFEHDLMLFAGGSGITPIISILTSALATSDVNVSLFYANRNRDSVIFDTELARLEARYSGRLHVEHWLESERGIPSAEQLREFASELTGRHAYICGPGPFMSAVEACLHELAVPHKHVHVERFVSLHGDPFAPPPAPATSSKSSTVSVELDGALPGLARPVHADRRFAGERDRRAVFLPRRGMRLVRVHITIGDCRSRQRHCAVPRGCGGRVHPSLSGKAHQRSPRHRILTFDQPATGPTH
jgi:3-ketosteroid 9alpha-monooxygenase subunit B